MIIELRGILKIIYTEEKITDTMSKKEIVITVDHDQQYPQDIIVQALNKQIDQLDSFRMGDMVIAKVNLKGREHNGRYFNQFTLWTIQK